VGIPRDAARYRAGRAWARGGDVVDVAWLGRAGPDREAAGEHDGLDVPAGPVVLPGVPGVDLLALHAGNLLGQAVAAE